MRYEMKEAQELTGTAQWLFTGIGVALASMIGWIARLSNGKANKHEMLTKSDLDVHAAEEKVDRVRLEQKVCDLKNMIETRRVEDRENLQQMEQRLTQAIQSTR